MSRELANAKEQFQRVYEPVQQLYTRFVVEESLSREWNTASRGINSPYKNRSSERAKHFVERLRESWQHLLRDRATRSLTYNDEQFHALEKIKVSETGKRLKSLLNDDIKPSVAQEAECLADWYKMAQTIFLQTQILQKDVSGYEEALYDIKDRILRIKDDIKYENVSAIRLTRCI